MILTGIEKNLLYGVTLSDKSLLCSANSSNYFLLHIFVIDFNKFSANRLLNEPFTLTKWKSIVHGHLKFLLDKYLF
jgi:hypothetical protein